MAEDNTPPGRSEERHGPRLLWLVAGASLLTILGAIAGVAFLLSGAFSTAATTEHFALTHHVFDAGLRFSVRTSARDIDVPSLDDPAMHRLGAACYRIHCEQCHGGPGTAQTAEGLGQMPIASSLVESAREWPANWLYYVTRKGIRMTGMPAWEFRMSEHGLWSTVAFLRELPTLDAAGYREAVDEARGAECPPNASPAERRDRDDAATVLRQYACHACHRIEGVVGTPSHVGPSLANWSQRRMIAGVMPNTRDNLIAWLRDPQAHSPQTLMPNLGVTEAHARDMANYLFGAQ